MKNHEIMIDQEEITKAAVRKVHPDAHETLRIALNAHERGNRKLESLALGSSSSMEQHLRRAGLVEGVTYGMKPPRLTELGIEVARYLREVGS